MDKDGFSYENGVLINHKAIQDKKELAVLENNFAGVKAAILKEQGGISGQFDSEHLKAIHKVLFQEVYPWAGETRAARGGFQGVKDTQVNGVPQEMKYAPYKEIENRLDAIGQQLQKENFLKGLNQETFSERAAFYLDQYNHVHAFREGNGRTLQAAFTQLGKEAGFDIDFNQADPAKYNEARNYALVKPHPSNESEKNLAPLKNFFQEIASPQPGTEAEKARTAETLKVSELSPAIKRIEALRELEVTGTRVADRWDYLVKQQVKTIVEEPKNLKSYEKSLRAISKAILEGGTRPDHYVYKDAERLTKALDQVKYIAAGKEIPTPKALPASNLNQPVQLKTHEEAKDVFIKASAIISRELKDNGKPIEAYKLEDVVEFVSKVPYLGGKNKEHVKNALDAASKIIGLQEIGSVSEIKKAVSILEKPERNQSLGNTDKKLDLSRGGVER